MVNEMAKQKATKLLEAIIAQYRSVHPTRQIGLDEHFSIEHTNIVWTRERHFVILTEFGRFLLTDRTEDRRESGFTSDFYLFAINNEMWHANWCVISQEEFNLLYEGYVVNAASRGSDFDLDEIERAQEIIRSLP